MKYVDIIIVGSGMSGLYSAYKIKQLSPNTSFLILEKYKKHWIGGRTSNDIFYDTEIVTGAGIGRKKKDKLLRKLLHAFNFDVPEYTVNPLKNQYIDSIDTNKIMEFLRKEYSQLKDKNKNKRITFKQFAVNVLGKTVYDKFIISSGYSDYENEDIYETLYYYGMEDNSCCWKALKVSWKELVLKLYHFIGTERFKFSSNVNKISKIQEHPCQFLVETENGNQYVCNKVIIATTISTIRKLLPMPIYNDIEGQTFLRLYAKFDKKSASIMKEYIKGYTFVSGPLQKLIPMDADKGVYMIAYSDNLNAVALKNYLENNKTNRELYETLIEKTLGIPENSLHIIAIKDYYWPIGTHYYKPLNTILYKTREKFIHQAQHPENGMLVVGEVVSRNQGWVEGSLESVEDTVTKKWITTEC
jgi:thioredoxin reductase